MVLIITQIFGGNLGKDNIGLKPETQQAKPMC
jgi:hypothetical protein